MDLELPKPRPPEPYPEAKEIPYDSLLDFAPFETMKEYYPCPPANVSRNLMTEDIRGAQANQEHVQDPLDPMCLNKPFPDIWLLKPDAKPKKPNGGLTTNRHTNPLNPKYILPSGPNILPSGLYRFSNRTLSQNLQNDDIEKSFSKPFCATTCRSILPKENVPDPWRGCKPKEWTWMRNRMFYGVGLELHDIDIGKKRRGFVRQRPFNPLEPLYPTEPEETPEIKYRRLKFRKMAPRRKKTDPCEKALDNMYWRSEILPHLCKANGPLVTENSVSFDTFRYTLETLGLYYTDDEFERFKPFIDPLNIGSVRCLNVSRQLRHNDGFHIDVAKPLGFDLGYWGMPSTLGTGLAVLEHVSKYGKKCAQWDGHQQVYNPLNGRPTRVWNKCRPKPKPLNYGEWMSPFKYKSLEDLGKLQRADYFEGRPQTDICYPVGTPSDHIKLCQMETPKPDCKVTPAIVPGENQRAEWHQHWNSFPKEDLATHTFKKLSGKDFNMAGLEMAKEVGALGGRETANEVKSWQNSRLSGLRLPQVSTNNVRESQVNWIPDVDVRCKKSFSNKSFMPWNFKMANAARIADIETVKALQVID